MYLSTLKFLFVWVFLFTGTLYLMKFNEQLTDGIGVIFVLNTFYRLLSTGEAIVKTRNYLETSKYL